MAETGAADFGTPGQYGLLTKADSTRLLRMAMQGAIAHPAEGYAYRQLLRRMLGFVSKVDMVMLAELAKSSCNGQKEWLQLADELVKKAGIE